MDEPVPPAAADAMGEPGPYSHVLYETARALAQSPTLADAAPRMLGAVCRTLGWQFGTLWDIDHSRHVLRPVGVWQPPSQPFAEFAAITLSSTFTPGVGLPGRVWASREPAWIPDVTRDTNFPRAPYASRSGLHAAFALPIQHDSAVLGVMEFFSRDILEPTPDLLSLMTTVCRQIGLFVERRWATEDLDRFFTLSLDLFCVATFDGYFVRLNPAWQRVLGYTNEELCASPFMDFVHPDDRAATTSALSALTTGGTVVDFENRYRARDGSYKWLQWAAAPFPTQGLVYAAARDVTDRKAAEASLRTYADEMARAKVLQERNAERLAHLVRELDVARQVAVRAAAAKSQFLANMSHEIRTPMNAILGMTDLALGTRLTDQQRDYLGTVRESAEALLRIIDDVLDVSKVEAGRLALEKTPFSLRDTVEDAVRLLAPRAAGKGLALASRIAPAVPAVVIGDPGRLRQVILNLVGNAVKFTQAGEVMLDVEVDQASNDSVALRFRVTDTGIGIAQDKLWDIFGPFVQADASTTRRYGGTGLGLTISAQLVELMGGRIWIESELGKGSRFHFVAFFGLPEAPASLPAPSVVPSAPSRARTDGRALRVLVAEDNATNQKLIQALLATRGHRATLVENGRQAVEASARGGFDLVLMDVQMPDMGGLEATSAIRARERDAGGRVPIIALTAHAMAGDRERCLAAGMDAYLSKPLRPQELFEALDRLGDASDAPGGLNGAEVAIDPPRAVDRDTLLAAFGGNERLLSEAASVFLADAPALVARLGAAVQAGNLAEVAAAAHALKGAAGLFSQGEVFEGARRLEQMARAGDGEAVATASAGVDRALSALTGELQAFVRPS